jgi:hypothetical protein
MTLPLFVYIGPQRIKIIKEYKLCHGKYISVGFESDLGSIPRLFWWFLSPHDVKYSSIIHDYEWLLGDFILYDYHKANINFYFNAIKLDNIPKWKSGVSFITLEIVRIYKTVWRFFKFLFS